MLIIKKITTGPSNVQARLTLLKNEKNQKNNINMSFNMNMNINTATTTRYTAR